MRRILLLCAVVGFAAAALAEEPIPLHSGESSPQARDVSDENYNFPGSRDEIERAAAQCRSEVAELWDQRRGLPPYRMAVFQKAMGEAQVRCKRLEELALVMKKADEQLYTYKQSLSQARSAFD